MEVVVRAPLGCLGQVTVVGMKGRDHAHGGALWLRRWWWLREVECGSVVAVMDGWKRLVLSAWCSLLAVRAAAAASSGCRMKVGGRYCCCCLMLRLAFLLRGEEEVGMAR